MKFDADRAAKAVMELARRHKIILWRRDDEIPEAHIRTRQVWAPGVTDPYSYIACLHELGHIISPDAKRLHEKGSELACEAAAWEWAFSAIDPEILPKVNKGTRKQIRDAWGTYLPEMVE